MEPLRKIAFVLEEFSLGSPGQQLLDRFLVGYARDGEFRRFPELTVAVWVSENAPREAAIESALATRERDFKLIRAASLAEVVRGADGVIVAPRSRSVSASGELLRKTLEHLSAGTTCFVFGALAGAEANARRIVANGAKRKILLASGTSLATTFRLPDIELPPRTRLEEALMVAHGPRPVAEVEAMDGLLNVIARRRGGEAGVRIVRGLNGSEVWRAGDAGEWSWNLLAAAISRSNNVQGDPVRDGRTQDVVGFGLVPKLARDPRGWIVEHRDGMRSVVLVLDAVIEDFNFAVRSRAGTVTSAQLYRPPEPGRGEFDRLVAVLEEFFMTRKAPWPMERSLALATFAEAVGA